MEQISLDVYGAATIVHHTFFFSDKPVANGQIVGDKNIGTVLSPTI